eukprot:CAMPEP_0202688720 /NCGR_PEP_ID=MMETSP1385-20130828/4179_1 /ASSEMBLY_ACC=CAM_ASM_000861 /TAXON_ID=933848 /ORGANISM="Elphidium margaritaceum" /LENGTH=164 /DNA_ID=CAMNT_0049343749 /DNA_START=150 /DNA_END=644 /DNA_ORIENTATION=+
MSDEESEEEEEQDVKSLTDIQNEFAQQVGHKPHTVQQFLAFVKQNGHPFKFKDINAWWPTRPEPEEKPKQKAINADEYKDGTAPNDDDDATQNDAANDEPQNNDDGDGDGDGADKAENNEEAANDAGDDAAAENADAGGDAAEAEAEEEDEEEEEEEEEEEDDE